MNSPDRPVPYIHAEMDSHWSSERKYNIELPRILGMIQNPWVAQLAACSYSVGWYLLLDGTRLFINLLNFVLLKSILYIFEHVRCGTCSWADSLTTPSASDEQTPDVSVRPKLGRKPYTASTST